MSRLQYFISDLRQLPPGRLLVLGLVALIFLPVVLPCLLVSLPFAGISQGGR